ncbi:hypothetical protein GOP47_0014935 [Adiantum capillus-veneris]|uniref:Splicing factor U2af large subunit n=1 Tax=Adiantum capillus-veneris TaxID=13818 RepID=A0A9D4UMZ2_ADICA|nr:hypothetical protein GOP47_0014935 [Adiantum capillus-veneris]
MASYGEYSQDWEGNGRQHKETALDSYRDKERRDYRHRDSESSRDRSDRYEREHKSDRHRSRDRERSSHDRSREQDSRHYDHDYDYERERRHRRRTRSRSRERSRDRARSRSRSGSRDERSSKRASGFDMAPPGISPASGMVFSAGQLSGLPQAMPNVLAGFPFPGTQIPALSAMPMQAMTQQAMKHARRVYVGGLPPLANEQTIATFFSRVMQLIGGNSAPGDAVVNVYINHEKKFAFVEMRTVEEASNAMALDGITFEGLAVRVRRPSDYNPSLAATLGPSQPSPHLNLAAIGLTPGRIVGGADGPDKVFVGGLPYYLTEVQIKELLESFGPLRGFDLVKDRETGNSKGYAFCVYQDPAVTDVACAALNGLKMGDKTLTVRRATAGGQAKPDQENVLMQAQQQIAIQKLALQAASAAFGGLPNAFGPGAVPAVGNGVMAMEVATTVLCLSQLVPVDDLRDDKEFEDIYQDIQDECSKYGDLKTLVIPRPNPTGENVPGLGKAFVEYTSTYGSSKAKESLNGRKFAGNTVLAEYYSEDKFARGEMDG